VARTSVLALLILFLSACDGTQPKVIVGSKNFSEQVLLGEILAQHLERRGFAVERRLNLGGTLLAHEALISGQIDLYPEYSGTALMAILKMPAASDAEKIVGREYKRRFGAEWLCPLGFDNTFAMVVRGESTVSTLSEAAARKTPWKVGVGYEFTTRPDGLPGLLKTYGLRTEGAPLSMDLGLLYRALEQHQVEMVVGNSTDGLIEALKLKVLRDDRGYFPSYECALVVREAALAAHPPLRAALGELAGRFSDQTMRRLNYDVDGDHRAVADVARAFLQTW
jgi:glycine betaine/choline ABC-type transport system substrate-binding protein